MTPNNSPETNEATPIIVEEQATVVTVPVAVEEKRKPRISIRRRGGMFDVPEIAAVAFGGFLLLMVLIGYLFWLRPAQADLARRETARNALDLEYQKMKTTLGENQTTEAQVTNIVGSLERFETNYLSAQMQGNSSLFARLNEIIRANNLRNTAGPSYAPLETIALDKYDPMKETAKNQNLYPGTAVNVTVEGGYANLRRFISNLENSRQFIVIRAIEIEAENNNSSAGGEASADVNTVRSAPPVSGIPPQISGIPAPGGNNPNSINPRAAQQQSPAKPAQTQQTAPRAASGGRGSIVSMRLDLVAYFRRSGEVATGAQN